MKKCETCKRTLTLNNFYLVNKKYLFKHCKLCISSQREKKYKQEWKKLKEKCLKFYILNRKHQMKVNKKWREKNKDKTNQYQRKYYLDNKQKFYARKAVGRAIKSGKLIRLNYCEKCNKKCFPDAHHHKGYADKNKLNVQWLCKQCHLQKYS